jgi:hypothetical protein
MFEIPVAVQAILKDMQATGDDRPTGELLIGGQPAGTTLTDPTEWTLWRTFADGGRNYGNIAETEDGRAICIYCQSGAIKLAYAANVAGILDGTLTFDFTNAITLTSGLQFTCASINLIEGKLNVAIVSLNTDNIMVRRADFWRDTDGNGTGMAWVSNITMSLGTGVDGYPYPEMQNNLGASLVQKYDGGNLIVILPIEDFIYGRVQAFYSTDGETWTAGAKSPTGMGDHLPISHSQTFFFVDATTFWTIWLSSSTSGWFLEWTNSGAVCTRRYWDAGWGSWPHNEPWLAGFVNVNNTAFMCAWGGHPNTTNFYQYQLEDFSASEFVKAENWEVVNTVSGSPHEGCFFLLTPNTLICQSGQSYISGAGTAVDPFMVIPIKSIVVDRSKGGASQLVAVIDNSLGMFAPDSIGPWAHVIWFNKVIRAYLGYGANRQLVFTGLIDTILMSTYPAELTIKARDYSKLALDQMPQDDFYEGYDGTPRYAFTYYDKTPEYIFGDMATQAGWATGTVHVEVTGITLAQFETGHEKIADSFQRLCELTGFEWFTDEIGHVYFRKARDPSAVSVYSFVEGVDIFSLSYELDDEELYRTIVVWSGDENRDVIKSSGVWPAADYNNVLAKKTMIVNASDIVTDQAGAEAMVLAISNGITPKVRNVDFVVVGNPYLQIGDVIQVIESTTWISEHYRITEISHQMNSQGSPIFGTGLKCYHFAYGE